MKIEINLDLWKLLDNSLLRNWLITLDPAFYLGVIGINSLIGLDVAKNVLLMQLTLNYNWDTHVNF